MRRIEPGAALVTGAAEGFGGNLTSLARAAGVPLRTIMDIKSGGSRSNAATQMLLAILASNPNQAEKLCEAAKRWANTYGLALDFLAPAPQRQAATAAAKTAPSKRKEARERFTALLTNVSASSVSSAIAGRAKRARGVRGS